MSNAKQILASVLVLAICGLNLSACGQTGDLYLPSAAAPAKPALAASSPVAIP